MAIHGCFKRADHLDGLFVVKYIGIQFRGDSRLLNEEEATTLRERYNKRFPIARATSFPMWIIRLDERKMTDNTLDFGKKLS